MILYGSSLSPYVRKVLAVAAEKEIEIQLERTGVGPGQPSDAFVEASPLRKMPALRDGDYTLADSSAIVHYLDAKYPERPMIPADPRARGRTIWFDEYADTVLMACGGRIFFNRVVAPTFLGRAGDLDAATAAERYELPTILDYLEGVVPAGDGFLVGDGLTLADIAVASPFATLAHAGTSIDPERFPRTARFVSRILDRPSFAPWIERERSGLAKANAAQKNAAPPVDGNAAHSSPEGAA